MYSYNNINNSLDISYYLLVIYINDKYYLICSNQGLMVWSSIEGLKQSLARTYSLLDYYKPSPICITSKDFPSVKDMNFNPVLLYFTNKEYISDIIYVAKNIGLNSPLIEVDSNKIHPYLIQDK